VSKCEGMLSSYRHEGPKMNAKRDFSMDIESNDSQLRIFNLDGSSNNSQEHRLGPELVRNVGISWCVTLCGQMEQCFNQIIAFGLSWRD